MPFIPHTEDDVREMLRAIGVARIEDLFGEIPPQLRCRPLEGLPEGLSEAAITRVLMERAERDGRPLCFAGAGAYDHHVPAAVWELATRGEFYSAYTPYQAEASQGTLQVLYEYQTMMANLMAMEVSNASLYDGASALAEAVLMAVRTNRKVRSRRILLPVAVHPTYRKVVRTLVGRQGIELVEIPYDPQCGDTPLEAVERCAGDDPAALVVPLPNFFGILEDADALTDWAHERGALVIGLVNPLAMAVLEPPGHWGGDGADIACGEGQPLGIPLSSGGPYFGFLCCKQGYVRQMPGRLAGRTVDLEGRPGFTLTLQAREQHIRRSKATSNICTNQGLAVTAATIHMALLGAEGLERTAGICHRNTRALAERLCALPGVERIFSGPFFHETVLRLSAPAADVLRALAAQDIVGGHGLAADYPELGNALLVCATETRNEDDLDAYTRHLGRILSKQGAPSCPVPPKI